MTASRRIRLGEQTQGVIPSDQTAEGSSRAGFVPTANGDGTQTWGPHSATWKQPVRVATTANGTLATAFNNGDTVDGVVLVTGDRILLKNQTAGEVNGIYTVETSGAPTRAHDFNLSGEVLGAVVLVTEGTANADTMWLCTTDAPITLGTTALVFAAAGGGSGAPTTADYLVGTAQAGLSAEIVVGATPGGELGGTWAAPTVDATHSGSTHGAAVTTHEAAGDPHTGYRLESADHSHATTGLQGGTVDHGALTGLSDDDHGAVYSLLAHTHAATNSSKASGSGDVTTTASLADVTGATLSLVAGTYIVVGVFDVLVNNALNDRTFEGHLDVGTVDENDYAQLNAPGLVNVRATLSQVWRIVLGSTTTVKLRTQHSGGSVGDFTVKSTNTTITAYVAGGGIGAWTNYTPTLTAVTTNPTLGSSTISGRYKALDSKTYIVFVTLAITTGGAWNAGSGEWKFSLPTVTAGGFVMIGSAQVLDSGVGYFSGTCQITNGQTVIWPVVISDDTGNRIMAHNKPVTWATGDRVYLTAIIETT